MFRVPRGLNAGAVPVLHLWNENPRLGRARTESVDGDAPRCDSPPVADGYVEVDESRWPVVKLTYPPAPAPDATQRYGEMLRAFGRRRIAYWLIVDICRLDPLSISAADRAKLAAVIDERPESIPTPSRASPS